MTDLLTRLFFGGFVRMHVIYHATKEPICGAEMMEELGRHGYDVGAGTIYPILHQLEQAGLLTVQTEVVAGKRRKVYRATAQGKAALRAARVQLKELVSEILDDRPPRASIGRDRGTNHPRKKHSGNHRGGTSS